MVKVGAVGSKQYRSRDEFGASACPSFDTFFIEDFRLFQCSSKVLISSQCLRHKNIVFYLIPSIKHCSLFMTNVEIMRKRFHMNSSITSTVDAIATNDASDMKTKSTAMLSSILASLYYIATSVSLTLFNKLIFARFPKVDAPFLLLCQSLTSIVILSILSLFGKFSFPKLTTWTRSSFQVYLPLYISNLLMLLTSLLALKFTTLLMYNTLRRTSMIFVVAMHSLMNNTKPNAYTIAATTLVTLGALVAGTTDLAFDPIGYTLAFTANLTTAVYLVLIKRVRDKLSLSNLQLIFVNAVANLPFLAAVMITFSPSDGRLKQFSDTTFSILFFCSCAFAMVINHSIFVNTTTNDAIAQSIAAQLKDVVLLAASYLFIDDPSTRAKGNVPGVMMGFLGSLVYGVGKLIARNTTSYTKIDETQNGNLQAEKTNVASNLRDETSQAR